MDKGLDIDTLHCCMALHAALYTRANTLAESYAAFLSAAGSRASAEGRRAALAKLLGACGARPDWAAADTAVRWLCDPDNAVIPLGDPRYPPLLAQIAQPPPLMFVRGDPSALKEPQLAIVGSRRATAAGREHAYEFAARLAAAGLIVTSGLANGVDSAAHCGALAAGGRTIAVFGCGLDQVYPRANERLAARIRQAGALISEFPLASPPQPQHFPRRNRIISGLALGTLVVEAAETSGSLITAMHAAEQGREVFAVPGSIRNPLARGCHSLIKQGAALVQAAEDILAELPSYSPPRDARRAPAGPAAQPCPPADCGGIEHELLQLCDYDPTAFDSLVDRSGLTAQEVSSILFALELKGYIQSLPGGTYIRTGSHSRERP